MLLPLDAPASGGASCKRQQLILTKFYTTLLIMHAPASSDAADELPATNAVKIQINLWSYWTHPPADEYTVPGNIGCTRFKKSLFLFKYL
jgi:hypothetical protein